MACRVPHSCPITACGDRAAIHLAAFVRLARHPPSQALIYAAKRPDPVPHVFGYHGGWTHTACDTACRRGGRAGRRAGRSSPTPHPAAPSGCPAPPSSPPAALATLTAHPSPHTAELFHTFVTLAALLHFVAVYRVVRSPLGAGGIV